jgi:TM2 domain-containing membrane protein YozV
VRGTVLAFDFRSGEGKISGADGNRYSFRGSEWQGEKQPVANQAVDFEIADGDALAIYPVRGASPIDMSVERNRIAAALLALFLGMTGAHKFYMGKTGAGLVMLAISTFGLLLAGIPTIVMAGIALIEFVIYLTLTEEAFDATYIRGNKAWF